MKIHIFGASGSGVTTLGQALAKKLDFAYFDSDFYFWEDTNPPFTVKRSVPERNALIGNHLDEQADWILGGSIINWDANLFPVFDLIVFLWLPAMIRMERLKAREMERYGPIIHTAPVRKQLYADFLAWAADYDEETGIANRTLTAHQAWLKQQSAPILSMQGDLTTDQRLEMILHALQGKA